MSHVLTCYVGCGDQTRCLQRTKCFPRRYMDPSFHRGQVDDRTMGVMSQQWETGIWALAAFCAQDADGYVLAQGLLWGPCRGCTRLVPILPDDVYELLRARCLVSGCGGQVDAVPVFSYTGLQDASFVLRRLAGGMRVCPFLRDFKEAQLQTPGMHCTGSIAKKVLSLILECVNTKNNDVDRDAIHVLTLRSSTADMYLRHWREMIAAAIVCPDVVGCAPVNKCWRLLLQLTQMLNAAWRTADLDKDAEVREGAASIMELTANLMAPLYELLKPLDRLTADSGVHTLYLHAAVAHLRGELGRNRAPVAHLVDDKVEAHLRASSRYGPTMHLVCRSSRT
ncbi:hypothetical protein BU14_0076s0050 [Porphyra umbilicalis]|uniref:Uncharacterized protein n=1 Tax=Porphyra umbilicalis TaxID=2786 RepID=A0A1X6PF62_PORUM|nr:hypothetical protein BU14_0076s0050 [Porphyra umbilicalis]|eukprot:OSX79494.1 hypothetical protein BU14_0076s0050 [Porphyra umbilicalis]